MPPSIGGLGPTPPHGRHAAEGSKTGQKKFQSVTLCTASTGK